MLKTFSCLKEYAAQSDKFVRLTPDELRGLQSVLLEMLVDFHHICTKNHLTYFLTGGSALGARRHNGFIPWDDDIDVFMPREDYERLSEIVSYECGSKYWVQNIHTSEKYDLNFAKFRKLGTKYVELYETEPEKAGICLDVYPLDATYQNRAKRLLCGIINEMLFFISSCVRMYQKKEKLLNNINDVQLKRIIRIKSCIGKVFHSSKNPRKWYFYCENWCKKVIDNRSKYVVASSGRGHYFGEMYNREKLLPPVLTDFKGQQVFVARDNDYLLGILYGPKYLLPPEEKQKESHALLELIINTEEKDDDTHE